MLTGVLSDHNYVIPSSYSFSAIQLFFFSVMLISSAVHFMSKRSLSPSHFLHISSSKKFPFSSQLTILNCYYCFSSIFILVFSLSNVFENVSEKPENSLFRNARGGEAIRAGGQVR